MNIAREGYPFLFISALMCGLGFLIHWGLGVSFCILFFFVLFFFRDPHRISPENPSLVVSAADGKVLKIEELESSDYYDFPHRRISVFMSPFNVHVNRVPMDGVIQNRKYYEGKFFNASFDKASELNERNALWIKGQDGTEMAFVQIAGFIARRIISYAKVGDLFKKGDRYGIIRFGSRMELYFPRHWKVLVKPGDYIKAGETAVLKKREGEL